MTTDPNGRFIIVTGYINLIPVTLVNIFGPNTDDPACFRKVFDLILDDDSSHIVIGGDLSCYLDPYLDRLSTAPPPNILAVLLVDSRLISNVTYTKYHNILISDHSPVNISLICACPDKPIVGALIPISLRIRL